MSPRKPIIILRGIPGVGKSTTSALVRERLQPALRVSNDDIRYLAKPRDFSAFTLGASEAACLELAASYAERGFVAVVDGVFYDLEFLEAWTVALRRRGIPLIVVSLSLTLEDILMRNRTRDELARMPEERLRELHGGFRPFGHVIDIKESLPEQVADDVVDHVDGTPTTLASEQVELLFLRHGAPEYPKGCYPDHLNMPLSSAGRAEALAARHAVTRFAPDVVIASDMRRAVETASLVAPDTEVTVTPELRERTFTAFYGRPNNQLIAEHGEEARPSLAGNSDLWEPAGEETMSNARERVLYFVSSLVDRGDLKRVLIAGHGGPHAWLVERALGVDLTGNRALKLGTGNFSKFLLSTSGIEIAYLNSAPEGAF